MAVYRVYATEPHGRRLLVGVVASKSKEAALADYLAGAKTVPGRGHVAELVK